MPQLPPGVGEGEEESFVGADVCLRSRLAPTSTPSSVLSAAPASSALLASEALAAPLSPFPAAAAPGARGGTSRAAMGRRPLPPRLGRRAALLSSAAAPLRLEALRSRAALAGCRLSAPLAVVFVAELFLPGVPASPASPVLPLPASTFAAALAAALAAASSIFQRLV